MKTTIADIAKIRRKERKTKMRKTKNGAIKRLAILPALAIMMTSCSQSNVANYNYKTDAEYIYVYYSDRLAKSWYASEYDWLGYIEEKDGIIIKSVKSPDNGGSGEEIWRYVNCQWSIYYK